MEDHSTSEAFKAPITKYGIYVALAIAALTIGVLYLLRLDNVPVLTGLMRYYIK